MRFVQNLIILNGGIREGINDVCGFSTWFPVATSVSYEF